MSSISVSDYIISNGVPINKNVSMPSTIYNFDTFDNSQPNLISKRVLCDINNICSKPKLENKVMIGISSIYEEYISPNMFPIIMLIFFCIYLLIKYILKKDKDTKHKYKHIKQELNVSDIISDDYDIVNL
jgi:hypothetical protein